MSIMNLFRSNKGLIPNLKPPEDKIFDLVEQYKENENLDDDQKKDLDFPLPKIEDRYIKIDEKNELNMIDDTYISNIYDNISIYRYNQPDSYDEIFKILIEVLNKVAGFYGDYFDYSTKISSSLDVTKEDIEQCYEVLLKKNNATDLNFDATTLVTLGKMVSYSYSKIDQYKIKDVKKFEESINKVLTKKINIYDNFVKDCVAQGKKPQEEKITEYYKRKRKEYDCLPEVIFLVNHYREVTTVNLKFDNIYNDTLSNDDYKFFKIAVLNLHWILSSLKNVKYNFISYPIEKSLSGRYKEKLNEVCNKTNDIIKPKDIIFNHINFFTKKWNFSWRLKLNQFHNVAKGSKFAQSKSLKLKKKNFTFNAKSIGNAFKKVIDFGGQLFTKDITDENTRANIVRKHQNLFELMILSIFTLNNIKKKINLELIMNDCLSGEFLVLLVEIYKYELVKKEDINTFHILDLLLFNNIMSYIEKFNIEINTLDPMSFNKLLCFLYFNKSLTKLNLSLFTSDIVYIPQFLFKIYSEIISEKPVKLLKKNFDNETYLFCNIKDIEDKILDKLFWNFMNLLGTLFEILNNKKELTELGFNIEPPINIRNKPNYMNAIYKFILNTFFYVSRNKIKKFCVISPFTDLDSAAKPEINELIESVHFAQNKNLEELTLQIKFNELESIKCFLSTRLRILNIGNLDLKTFKYLCNNICTYDFNSKSDLEELTIELMNSITDFSTEIKILLERLFSIKINALSSLTLLTNLYINDKKQYLHLLKLLNYNWISEYTITFNEDCQENYNPDEHAATIKYMVPQKLVNKLCNMKIKKMMEADKNKSNIDEAYWVLKYLFNNKYTDNLKNFNRTKRMIFDIIKYIHVIQTPTITNIYSRKGEK